MLEENGYVSRMDSTKRRKIANSIDCDDDGFVLDTVQFINNNTDSESYVTNRAAAITWSVSLPENG